MPCKHNLILPACEKCVAEERDRMREALKNLRKNIKAINYQNTYILCRDSWLALIDEALKPTK